MQAKLSGEPGLELRQNAGARGEMDAYFRTFR